MNKEKAAHNTYSKCNKSYNTEYKRRYRNRLKEAQKLGLVPPSEEEAWEIYYSKHRDKGKTKTAPTA